MNSTWVQRVKASQSSGLWSKAGATFQEYCLANLDYKGSEAHKSIGRLVTAINNGVMPADLARSIYNGLLSKG